MKLFLFLMVWVYAAVGTANDSSYGFSIAEIFTKSRDAYASLASYSDEGTYVQHWLGEGTVYFKIKMSRPDLYRVSWVYASSQIEGVAWSVGSDDFITEDGGKTVKNEEEKFANIPPKMDRDQIKALSQEEIFSGLYTSTIVPGIFFNTLAQDNPLYGPSADEKQLSNEKIGGVDCYVFIGTWKHRKNLTIWIGKSDFLIRQIKIVKANDVETAKGLNEAQDKLRNMIPSLPESNVQPQDTITIETHLNIVANKKFSSDDFLQ